MGVTRRLYLYLASGISLAVMASGAYMLLSLALRQAATGFGGRLLSSGSIRSELSLAIALVLVALPLWALHWYLATRGTDGPDEAGLEERRSAIRSLYFAVVALVGLLAVLTAGFQLLSAILATLLGASDRSLTDAVSRIALVVVAGAVWAYHFSLRGRELRRTPLSGVAAWLPRLYRYGASWIGLGMMVFGASGAISVILEVLVGAPTFGGDPDSAQSALVSPLAALVCGSLVWLVHWFEGERAARDAHLIGEDERRTRLRSVYFGGVILVASAAVLLTCFTVLDQVVGWLAGVDDVPDLRNATEDVLGPLLTVLPVVVAGGLHLRRQIRELVPVDAAAVRSAQRVAVHLVAAVGLVMLSAGAFQLLDVILHALIGGQSISQIGSDSRLPTGIAAVIVGAAAWLPSWTWILRRRAERPEIELRAAASRGYVYLAIALALIAFVPAAALIVFRTIDTILGASGGGLGSALATPLAVSIVALAVAGYHSLLLREEQAVGREMRPDTTPAMADTTPAMADTKPVPPTDAPASLPERVGVQLWLERPADTNLAAILDALNRALPAGTTLDVQSTAINPAKPD